MLALLCALAGCKVVHEPDQSPKAHDPDHAVRAWKEAKARLKHQFVVEPLTRREFQELARSMIAAVEKRRDLLLSVHGDACEVPYPLFGAATQRKFFRLRLDEGDTYSFMSEHGMRWTWADEDFGYFADDREFRDALITLLRAQDAGEDATLRINARTYLMPKEAVLSDTIYFHCDTAPPKELNSNFFTVFVAFQFGERAQEKPSPPRRRPVTSR